MVRRLFSLALLPLAGASCHTSGATTAEAIPDAPIAGTIDGTAVTAGRVAFHQLTATQWALEIDGKPLHASVVLVFEPGASPSAKQTLAGASHPTPTTPPFPSSITLALPTSKDAPVSTAHGSYKVVIDSWDKGNGKPFTGKAAGRVFVTTSDTQGPTLLAGTFTGADIDTLK